jgi:UPF0755 protein
MPGTASPPQSEQNTPLRSDAFRKKAVATGFFFFFILLWILIHFLNKALAQKKLGGVDQRQYEIVEIEPGSSVSDIAEKLAAKNVISDPLLFRACAMMRRSLGKLKAGEYRFERSMSMLEVLKWLESGHIMLHKFTVPEGFTTKQIAELLEKKELADAGEFMRLANDPVFCEELGVGGPNLEGFLFPDTYKIAKGLPARRMIRIMVDRFWKACSGDLSELMVASDMSLREIVTIASIIEKEAIYDDEEPLMAGVIFNRLRVNMPLQCDVTIRYPLDNYGVDLTYEDLRLDSPYNSYLNKGLPPTPICNPGLSAIRAAVQPSKTRYYYFVSMNNGRHKFSVTYQEHSEAVFKYQVLNDRG